MAHHLVFALRAGAAWRVHHGVRTTLTEVHPQHLRKGAVAATSGGAPKRPDIGRGVRDIVVMSVAGQQPEGSQERAPGGRGSQAPADTTEQAPQGPDAELIAAGAEGARSDHGEDPRGRLQTQEAEARNEPVPDGGNGRRGDEAHAHHQPEPRFERQFALPLGVETGCGQSLL